MDSDQKPALLRPAKFARLIDMSRSKVYELIQSGEIRAVTIGGVLRVPLEELERLKSSPSVEQ
jgi:excisionase family DNA binding protein